MNLFQGGMELVVLFCGLDCPDIGTKIGNLNQDVRYKISLMVSLKLC